MAPTETPEDLIDVPLAELDNERRMRDLGMQRHRAITEASIKGGKRTRTRSGQSLLREAVRAMDAGVAKWVKESRARRRKNPHAHGSLAYLELFKAQTVAVIVSRVVLDAIAKDAPLVQVSYAIGAALEDERRCDAVAGAGKGSLWRDLKRTLKRTRGPYERRKIVRAVAAQLGATVEPWPKVEKIRLGLLLAELFRVSTGLVTIRNVPTGPRRRPKAMVSATQRTMDWLAGSDARGATLAPMYLPTLVRPRDWTDPWDGGYLSNVLLRRPLLKTRDRSHVVDLERARPTEVYRAVNNLQRTAWEVNPFVHAVARDLMAAGAPLVGFAERVDESPPPKPLTPKDRSAPEWRDYIRAAADWRKRRGVARGNRVQAARTLAMAAMFAGKTFWYPYQVDFRGRVYPVPFFLQPQGNSLARGLLRFAVGKAVRDREQAQWLRAHLANAYGLDKKSFQERVAWVQAHHDRILAVAAAPTDERWWMQAERPWEFLAACDEYAHWSAAPATFVSRLPVAMDCTNSGLQLFSLLMRDPVGAEATNCVPTLAPRDVYQDVADRTVLRLQADAHPDAAKWLEFCDGRLPRAAVKRATMTLPYSSTFHSCVNYVRDWYEEARLARGSSPFEELDGGGYKAAAYLARHVWEAIGDTLGPARACMDWLRTVADLASECGTPLRWESPIGFTVKQAYTKYQTRRVETRLGDVVRYSRYRDDAEALSARRQANGVVPNFIHSIDSAVLMRTVNRARDDGVRSFQAVHDSFGCLAADAPVVARNLRAVVADTFKEDWLERFRGDAIKVLPEGAVPLPAPERGHLDPELVRGALYFAS